MAISQFDFTKGIDFTALANAAAADHNTLVDAAVPFATDKGIVMVSDDTALNTPDVPAPAGATLKWKNYIWIRRPHSTATSTTPIAYTWNDNAVSAVTYLKWQRIPADTTALEALITALTLRVDDLEASTATILATANAANATASIASTNATAALNTANTANTNATTALSDLNTPTTGVKDRVTALETRVTAVESNITAINTSITTINNTLASGVGSLMIESPSFPMATGVIATIAHGLGVVPKYVNAVLVCSANDAATGMIVGDETPLDSISRSATTTTFGVIVNVTNIILSLDPSLTGWVISNKTTGVKVAPTDINNFRVKAYYAKQ